MRDIPLEEGPGEEFHRHTSMVHQHARNASSAYVIACARKEQPVKKLRRFGRVKKKNGETHPRLGMVKL